MIPDLSEFHLPVFMAGCSMSQKPMQQRPWPPVYRHHVPSRSAFYFRQQELPPWVDYSRYGGGYREKGREYYYLAPLYRNAMPPPLQPSKMLSPRRVMLVNPHVKKCYNDCSCLQRSRSLEDVRSEITSEWSDDDFSGFFRYDNRKLEAPLPNEFGHQNRMFFDDSIKLDVRKRGKSKVREKGLLMTQVGNRFVVKGIVLENLFLQ